MLVGDRMSHPVITVTPQTTLDDAWKLMSEEHISRLPVVDKKGRLVGIVSEKKILRYTPSEATMLDVWEIKGVMNRIQVQQLMTHEVITVSSNTPLEEAARIMADNEISGIPVVDDGKLVGLIAETDIFKAFLEVLGARDAGIRLSVLLEKSPGKLAALTQAIFNAGGNIISIGSFYGQNSENGEITLKVEDISQESLLDVVRPFALKIMDVRQTGSI